jgi:hypothetical protein
LNNLPEISALATATKPAKMTMKEKVASGKRSAGGRISSEPFFDIDAFTDYWGTFLH